MNRKPYTPSERGFLLLTSHLGDAERKPLTAAQFRELTKRVKGMPSGDLSRDVEASDFMAAGYSVGFAKHIVGLLQDEPLLDWYLARGEKQNCVCITRATQQYPLLVRRRLGADSPGVLWAKGDLSLLNTPSISLVGSRELREENWIFAEVVGRQAAIQGLTLVSGNARGADKAAQKACLEAGGRVISVVADSLAQHSSSERILYLSEDGFEEAFSAQRALSRNRVIHTLGQMVFVAQSDLGKGGTWDGTVKNLRQGWSTVACFRDGSKASVELEQMGAWLIGLEELSDLGGLKQNEYSLFDR